MNCLYYAECNKKHCETCKRNRDNEQEVRNAFGDNFEASQNFKKSYGKRIDYGKQVSYGKRIEVPERRPLTETEAWEIIESGYDYCPLRLTSTQKRRAIKRLRKAGYGDVDGDL